MMHGRRCSEEVLMETTLYTREFLFVQELYRSGRLGKLQFLRASHHQDMTGWPSYWDGMPPMYNATHAIGPTLGLAGHQAEYVQALGSGSVFESMKATRTTSSRNFLGNGLGMMTSFQASPLG
jgi:predicted dehydrogenase